VDALIFTIVEVLYAIKYLCLEDIIVNTLHGNLLNYPSRHMDIQQPRWLLLCDIYTWWIFAL